jgi:hypothetical protein
VIACKRGQSRCVLVCHSIALKFARGNWGARCNLYEAQLYKSTTEWRRKLLCPVIWCSANGAVLVMRAAKPLTKEQFDRAEKENQLPDWKRVPGSNEVTPFEECECKFADFGWLEDRIVVMDYAADPALTDRWLEPCTDEAARAPGYEDW